MNKKEKFMRLVKENVRKLYDNCFTVNKEEDYVDSVYGKYYFDSFQIKYYSDEISSLFSQVLDIEIGVTYDNLYITKDYIKWGNKSDALKLCLLGLANGDIEYIIPKELWDTLSDGKPYVRLVKQNQKKLTKLK